LGFVEAVDFIDKEDSALRVFGAQFRAVSPQHNFTPERTALIAMK